MKYTMNEKRWNSIKSFFDNVFENPEQFPDKSLILSLSDKELTTLFTKKRIELIRIIKRKKIKSLSELAKLVKRELSAVERDLKILESFGVVSLIKKGKTVTPIIEKEILILPLIDLRVRSVEKLTEIPA